MSPPTIHQTLTNLIPATQIARAQRVAVDASASIATDYGHDYDYCNNHLSNECYFLSSYLQSSPDLNRTNLFPSLLLSVAVTTHCAPVVTVSRADAPQSATLGDLNTIGQQAWHLTQG